MDSLFAAIERHAARQPRAVALWGGGGEISYGALPGIIGRLADAFVALGYRRFALLMDNAPAWVLLDLAAHRADIVLVPLPAFFTDAQLAHAIQDAGIEAVISDRPARIQTLLNDHGLTGNGTPLVSDEAGTQYTIVPLLPAWRDLPPGTRRITYTSGTTGAPKGVCLSGGALETVAESLLQAVGARSVERHLCALPLAILLENLAGVYLPLSAGGRVYLPALTDVGFGSAGFEAERLARALAAHEATSAILMPQMLQALCETDTALPALRFLATGGAPVAGALLERARARGLPVFEGYGLSECASVVALNTPAHERSGSVGRPLPHVRLQIADDGEVQVRGARFLGYLGLPQAAGADGFWPTGDTGFLDEAGFLHITGRKKNIFITSFGRNVAPEWVECELMQQPVLAQAAVFGEARPWNAAVVMARAGAAARDIDAAIRAANASLPPYAQIGAWIAADGPFTVANGQMTGTGRLRREGVWAAYGKRIEHLYQSGKQDGERA